MKRIAVGVIVVASAFGVAGRAGAFVNCAPPGAALKPCPTTTTTSTTIGVPVTIESTTTTIPSRFVTDTEATPTAPVVVQPSFTG